MGVFQASMPEAMKSLRDEFQSLKETSKGEVDLTSSSASKPGTSKQPENMDPTPPRTQSSSRVDEAMDVDLHGPSLPPQLGSKQSIQDSDPRHLGDHQPTYESDPRHVSDEHLGQSEEPSRVVSARPKKHAEKRKHKVRSRYPFPVSSSGEDQCSVHKHRSSKPCRAPSALDQPQHDPDPLFYREVAMADLPSQYAEEVETFRRILNLPDPRETMPRSSASILGLDDQKANRSLGQEALVLCSYLVLTSRMPLTSLNMILRPLTYLRVNVLNPLPPLQSGTRWDSPVTKTKSRS